MLATLELTDGMMAMVQTGRQGLSGIRWSTPFVDRLNIETDRKGVTSGLSLKHTSFAEFDQRYHREGRNEFLAEDYALRIVSGNLEEHQQRFDTTVDKLVADGTLKRSELLAFGDLLTAMTALAASEEVCFERFIDFHRYRRFSDFLCDWQAEKAKAAGERALDLAHQKPALEIAFSTLVEFGIFGETEPAGRL
uniref:Uncharacterized protein n=1 Tax=Pseudomonas monteilii TaxID=76759 RepID=A0A6B7PVU0_9PSED|nr:hypothetical protein [Pseudomonas monteilii]QFX76409.1 hypothetical protein [Pseudomonas monteilii]